VVVVVAVVVVCHHTRDFLNVYKNYKQQLALFGKGKGQI